MSQVVDNYTVCDFCNGILPDGADRIQGVNGTLVIQGQANTFNNLDFCCTEHMGDWIASKPQIATPNPVYQPPAQQP